MLAKSDPTGIVFRVGVLHVAGCGAGDGFTMVTGDDAERQVNASGDPGRGEHVAVLYDV